LKIEGENARIDKRKERKKEEFSHSDREIPQAL